MPKYIYALWGKSVHFCFIDTEDYDLEQKIDLESKMQEGTTKLLAACKYQLQTLEAAKSLLTSSERMSAYVFELQRRKAFKKKLSNASINNNIRFSQNTVPPSKGKIAITDIRMPLIWKDSDHFKDKGDCRRFAVFCLLKLGTEVYDTAMLTNVDRSMTDIAFEDTIIFNEVPHDFEFRLEVYSYLLQEDLTIASASNKLRKKISYSVSKAIGKKLVNHMKEDTYYKGGITGLERVAHATLSLEDSGPRIKTYDLETEGSDKPRQLPLFGHFCCRMVVQPCCMLEEVYSGYLSLVQQIGNLTGTRRMWSSLKNFSLSMWTNAAEIHDSKPDLSIPIKKNTYVQAIDNSNSYPRYSLRIKHTINNDATEYTLGVDTSTELTAWHNHLQQHVRDYDLWKPASDTVVQMPSPTMRRRSQFPRNRNSSLYDETPFTEGAESLSSGSTSPFYEKNKSYRYSTPPLWSSSSSSTSTSDLQEQQKKQRPKSLYRKSPTMHLQF